MLLNAFNLSRSYNQRRAFPRAEAELRKLQAKVITTGNCINVWNSMQRSNEQYPSELKAHIMTHTPQTQLRSNIRGRDLGSSRWGLSGILDLPNRAAAKNWKLRQTYKTKLPFTRTSDMFQYSEKRITHRLQKLAHEPHAILLGPLFVYEFHRDSNLPPKKC